MVIAEKIMAVALWQKFSHLSIRDLKMNMKKNAGMTRMIWTSLPI